MGRTEMVPEDNFIQCATLWKRVKLFHPHKHITKERTYPAQIAQESWVVRVVLNVFSDIDDSIIATPILKAGDASFTYMVDIHIKF
jgi:phosphatidate phosphatase APP1